MEEQEFPDAMPMHQRSEYLVAAQIQKRCKSIKKVQRVGSYSHPFDVTADGVRVEVKDSEIDPNKQLWRFNLHRHGALDESQTDCYVLCLRGLAKCARLFVILPAPQNKKTIQISLRGLFNKYAK